MPENESGYRAFTAGEALEPRRRVKLTGNLTVSYADAGENFIGVTGHRAANGKTVSVLLKTQGRTVECIASEAFAVNATLYGAADGKVGDTSSGSALGTALKAASADGEIIEVLFDDGEASSLDGASTAIAVLTGAVNGGIPFIYSKAITDATTAVTIVTAQFDFRIIDWWLIARDADAANVKLINDTTDATANVAKGTVNDAIVHGGTLIAAQDEVSSGDPLKVEASAAELFDIFVKAIRI